MEKGTGKLKKVLNFNSVLQRSWTLRKEEGSEAQSSSILDGPDRLDG